MGGCVALAANNLPQDSWMIGTRGRQSPEEMCAAGASYVTASLGLPIPSSMPASSLLSADRLILLRPCRADPYPDSSFLRPAAEADRLRALRGGPAGLGGHAPIAQACRSHGRRPLSPLCPVAESARDSWREAWRWMLRRLGASAWGVRASDDGQGAASSMSVSLSCELLPACRVRCIGLDGSLSAALANGYTSLSRCSCNQAWCACSRYVPAGGPIHRLAWSSSRTL